MNYKRELFSQLQQYVLKLTEACLTQSILLETMIQIEHVALVDVSTITNADLQRFGRRNL